MSATRDWTVDPETGRSNSSAEFLCLVNEVDRLIRSEASALIHGSSRKVAGLIMAQLAHRHGLAPVWVDDPCTTCDCVDGCADSSSHAFRDS